MAQEKNRWADYLSVEYLWDRIRKRYDKKLDNVVSHDASVKVTGNNRVSVNISAAEGNQLQLNKTGDKGLYVAPAPKQHKLIFGADQEYIYDGSEDVTVPVYKGDYNE